MFGICFKILKENQPTNQSKWEGRADETRMQKIGASWSWMMAA